MNHTPHMLTAGQRGGTGGGCRRGGGCGRGRDGPGGRCRSAGSCANAPRVGGGCASLVRNGGDPRACAWASQWPRMKCILCATASCELVQCPCAAHVRFSVLFQWPRMKRIVGATHFAGGRRCQGAGRAGQAGRVPQTRREVRWVETIVWPWLLSPCSVLFCSECLHWSLSRSMVGDGTLGQSQCCHCFSLFFMFFMFFLVPAPCLPSLPSLEPVEKYGGWRSLRQKT